LLLTANFLFAHPFALALEQFHHVSGSWGRWHLCGNCALFNWCMGDALQSVAMFQRQLVDGRFL